MRAEPGNTADYRRKHRLIVYLPAIYKRKLENICGKTGERQSQAARRLLRRALQEPKT